MPNSLFLYHFSYQDIEEALAKIVFTQLFGKQAFSSFVVSSKDYDLENWSFLHFKIEVFCFNKDYTTFKKELNQLDFHDWHLDTWHYNKNLDYHQRIDITKDIADSLSNIGKITDYSLELLWALLDGIWYLGIVCYNRYFYKLRIHKPYQYSSALPVRLCHQLINLLHLMLPHASFIDPAAGSGTLVIEALLAGLNIRAYEINKILCQQANANLQHFGLPAIIENCDMLQTTDTFTVCILDLPYGLFTAVAKTQQISLLQHSLNIADYLLLISTDDYGNYLENWACQVIWQCQANKAKFTRLLSWIKK